MRGKLSSTDNFSTPPPEYPRVCGENRNTQTLRNLKRGTSPRMRGKPSVCRTFGVCLRNIPAYAGKTGYDGSIIHSPMEHPRVCGENQIMRLVAFGKLGTSPRMRGKQHRKIQPQLQRRNIPAYAGKQTLRITEPGLPGNIPAYAGKTSCHPSQGSQQPEHPRVCGENPGEALPPVPSVGTSPRMRGKPGGSPRPPIRTRNIPAYAGKTADSIVKRLEKLEHPRVCGENCVGAGVGERVNGTSPRMRGKHQRYNFRGIEHGNIPAYAGKTGEATARD